MSLPSTCIIFVHNMNVHPGIERGFDVRINIKVCLRAAMFFILALGWSVGVRGQQRNAYSTYIDTYADLAVEQMNQYGIPASITLAQALIESAAGCSRLAVKANNHFGIKCGSVWRGAYIRQDDDARGEKFRKYKNVRESYEDHSKFLLQPRYASLFKLEITDYKGWAYGLKRCGYATSPKYADALISTIERYGLTKYDRGGKNLPSHAVYKNNEVYYIVAHEGDSFKDIAKETGVRRKKLYRYNEFPSDYVLREGDVVYLEQKRKRAEKRFKKTPHVVKAGESMHSIAQLYGVQMKYLYKMNRLDVDYVPRAGDVLRVR